MKLKIILVVLLLLLGVKSSAEYNNLEENDNTELVITKTEDIIFTTINLDYESNIIVTIKPLLSSNEFIPINVFDYAYNKLLPEIFINRSEKRMLIDKNKSNYTFKEQLIIYDKKIIIIKDFLLFSLNNSVKVMQNRSP